MVAGTDREHRHHGAGAEGPRRHGAAGGRAARRSTSRTSARVQPVRLPQWLPRLPRSRSIRTPASSRCVKYFAVNDFGTIINPLMVEGQTHGGVVQGIGQCLMEKSVVRRRGPAPDRLVHGLRACRAPSDTPSFDVISHPVPATTNPLGVKGCGEAGCAGSLTSIDERRGRRAVGIRHPAHRHAGDARAVWQAIHDGEGEATCACCMTGPRPTALLSLLLRRNWRTPGKDAGSRLRKRRREYLSND